MSFSIEHIITQIIAFILMLYILKRFAWKPLLDILDKRAEKIANEFASIEEQKEAANELVLKYEEQLGNIEEEARIIIQDAVKQGRQISDEIQANAQNQAKETVKKAHEEVQREVAKAKLELKGDVVNMTVSLFEKMMLTKLSPEENEKLSAKLIEEVDLK